MKRKAGPGFDFYAVEYFKKIIERICENGSE